MKKNDSPGSNSNIASITYQITERMAELRKKFMVFIKWHEAYAYIKKEIHDFEKIAVIHQDIVAAEIILCENCGSTYDDIYGSCPLCGFLRPDYNVINTTALKEDFLSMRKELIDIASQSLLASSECPVKQQIWSEAFGGLATALGELNWDYDLQPGETIENVFNNGIKNNLDELWKLILVEDLLGKNDSKKEGRCYSMAAYAVFLINRIDKNLKHLNTENENERRTADIG